MLMKRIILYLILSTATCISVMCKNIDDILEEYAKSPQANYVCFDSTVYSHVKDVMLHYTGQKLTNKVYVMKILHLGNCSEQTKYRFARHLLAADMNGYISLMEDGKMTLLSKEGEIVLISKTDLFIIKFEGNFTGSDLEKMKHNDIAFIQ